MVNQNLVVLLRGSVCHTDQESALKHVYWKGHAVQVWEMVSKPPYHFEVY